MSRYLDPKADVVFKKVFGEHPHLLISFLNAVLPLPEERKIATLEYLNAENTPIIPALKRTIADVRCTDNEGRVFIVEMQIAWTDSFKQRLLFESGQAFVKQLNKGEDYRLLKPVYGLGIIATNFDPTEQWYHHYQIVNINKTPREIIEHLQLIFIELPKFPVRSDEHKQLRSLWLRFLREINEKTTEVSSDLLAVPEIQEAVNLVQESAFNSSELQAYESYWDAVSVEKTIKGDSFSEGKVEGFVEGKAEGLAQGEAIGEAKLQQEKIKSFNEKKEIAQKLLAQGLPKETICEITGLKLGEIN
jgi:predicted transposase/invertase (TIGR01784 family)